MFRKNELKKHVLQCILEMGRASSRHLYVRLRSMGVSRNNVSVTLLKCFRQRLVGRTLFKFGRVRRYYVLSERGRKRLQYYSEKGAESNFRVVNVDELVEEARRHDVLLHAGSLGIFNLTENLCSRTLRSDVFSEAEQCATLSPYQILNNPQLISAFAARKTLGLLNMVFGEVRHEA